MTSSAASLSSPPEGRLQPRTHLFVAATLYSDGGSAPVHVRNMSLNGAHIESPTLPEPGASVVLRRGSLEAQGQMAWKVERKGGIAFSGVVEVGEWMARVQEPQAQVDRIVRDFRANQAARDKAPAGAANDEASLREELERLRADIAQLGNSLSSDIVLVATHPEIQLIDISLQRIDRLIGRI